jgi:hypothetical protein
MALAQVAKPHITTLPSKELVNSIFVNGVSIKKINLS